MPETTPPQTISLHLPEASPSWRLIFQSGAGIACTVGVPLSALLRDGFGLNGDQLRPVDVLLLDGMPVDAPESTVVPDGARVALAAGLPGIAGLAMKSNSAVRGLRSGITHTRTEVSAPRPGSVRLFLYSLVVPLLAEHFLRRGVTVGTEQVVRYARFAPDGTARLDGRAVPLAELAQILVGMPHGTTVHLTAALCHD